MFGGRKNKRKSFLGQQSKENSIQNSLLLPTKKQTSEQSGQKLTYGKSSRIDRIDNFVKALLATRCIMHCHFKCSAFPKGVRGGGYQNKTNGFCKLCERYMPLAQLKGVTCSCCGARIRVRSRNKTRKEKEKQES